MPGWINSDDGNKARIVRAAKAYLSDYVPADSQNWIDTNSCPWELLVGFQALILLLEKDAAFLDNLSIECWSRWATLPLVRRFSVEKERETCSQLLGIAYRKAPISILEGLRRFIRKENGLQGMVYVLENVDPVLDPEIEAELGAILLQPDLAANSFGDIIGVLLKRGVASALDIANKTLENIPAEGEQRKRAESVARALILFVPDAHWSVLWPIAQQDRQFMVDILASVNGPFELKQSLLANKLSEDQIADLYIWLAEQIPYSEETFEGGLGFAAVGPGQSLRWLRDSLLERLKQRATGSCAAFRRVATSLPQYSFLRWHLAEAEQIARAVWWKPISPDQLFKLTSNRDKRLVQSGAELLDVLLQSLRRLETAMQGETPFSHVVWNEQDGKYRPKNEGRLSDVIKLHFEQDLNARGIVVNREVEIRKGTGRTAGEETDIHVDAVALNPDGGYDRISAIIETKGCWNKEVRPAIEAQLVDRYLRENACPYGLYLVGWFVCTQWDREDYRWGDRLKTTLGEAREYFAEEAKRLSTDGQIVESFVLNCALR